MSKEQFATMLGILAQNNCDYKQILEDFRKMYSDVKGIKILNKLTKDIKTFKDCQKVADSIHLCRENM